MGITEELRWTATKLLTVGKFAVDSAVNESLKGLRDCEGKLKGEAPSNGGKRQSFVLVEEMQAKLEKMREDMNGVEHLSMTSTCRTDEGEQLKQFSDEPLKGLIPEVTGRKKIFIRSRL